MTYPWMDYGGRTSPLKLAVFAALFVPALWVAVAFDLGWLGSRPLNEAIHQLGLWTIRLIFIALAVTPLRHMLQWSRLLIVRRGRPLHFGHGREGTYLGSLPTGLPGKVWAVIDGTAQILAYHRGAVDLEGKVMTLRRRAH